MPFDFRTEMQLVGGAWIRVPTYERDAIEVETGRPDMGVQTDPGRLGITINNRGGRFSWRNPESDLYGQFGPNSRMRLSVPAAGTYLQLDGTATSNAATPDHASLDITGDLDVRIEAEASWYQARTQMLIGKWDTTGQRSYMLRLQQGGTLVFAVTRDGTSGPFLSYPLPALPKRAALRGTLDADNGAGGWVMTLYWAESMDGPWTQLTTVTGTNPVTIHNSSVPLEVGPDMPDTSPVARPMDGRVYRAQVRNGINGTIVAAPDFTAQAAGTTSFVDSAGRTWTLGTRAEIRDRQDLIMVEVPEWPQEWTPDDSDAWVRIEGAGVLRRLGQGKKQLQSTLRRRIPSYRPLAYWPMEEGAAATQAYSPIDGVQPLTLTLANWAADDSLASSGPLPTLASSGGEQAVMVGRVPAPASTPTIWQVRWVYYIDQGPTTRRTFMRVESTGTVRAWLIQSGTTGTTLLGLDDDGNTVLTHNIGTTSDLFGQWVQGILRITQDGGNVAYRVDWIDVGGDAGGFGSSIAGTIGRPTTIGSPGSGFSSDLDGMAIGHISVWTADGTAAYDNAITAWTGETAWARMVRLSGEENLPVGRIPGPLTPELVGVQTRDTVLNLLQAAADADGGMLLEDRDRPGLVYRDRSSMYAQDPALTLAYRGAPGLATPLAPVDDDTATRNDRTVKRDGGSEGRAVLEEGRLSVQDPPDGIGLYDDSVTLSLHSDEQTEPIAYWRLALGTVDAPRYPQVRILLHKAKHLIPAVLALREGDLVRITGLPKYVGGGHADLLVEGIRHEAGLERWTVTLNCTPGAPWAAAGVVDGATPSRIDANPGGSRLALALAVDEDATQMVVHTPAAGPGPLGALPWITSAGGTANYPAELPFDVRLGGEVVTVTANEPVAWDAFERPVAVGPVLNPNPAFETDLDGWTAFGSVIERVATPELAAAPFSGQWSMRITPDGVEQYPNAGSDLIPVTAGTQYHASGWLLSPTARDVSLSVNWFDGAGGYLSTDGTTLTVAASTWTRFTVTATAPVGAASANLAPTVPDFPPATDVLYADQIEFAAVLADTWGRADCGLTWAESGGAASERSLTGTAGVITLASAPATIRFQRLVASITDCEVLVRISADQVATGASMLPGILLRYVDGSNYYRARLHFGTGGALFASVTRAVTAIGGTPTLPYTYTAGQWIWLRARITGQRVQLRAWPDGQPEPPAWHKDETVVTDPITSGQVGVTASAFDTNTNVAPAFSYDGFQVVTPQLMTVQRSANGIFKGHAAGTELRWSPPSTIAL